jgi:hypothetical protein
MKVAQYEVLGWRSKKTTRPGRDGSTAAYAGEAAYERTRSQKTSIVPAGTDVSFCIISQHFVLGYFH